MEDGAFALALFSSLPRRIWQLNGLQPPKNANAWGSAPGEEGEPNREAPREDAKLKSEHKKVIKHVRLYSNENSFIFFYCNISQARLDLSDLFGREWLTTEYMRHSHVHSALLFQKQFKSTKQTVNNRQRKTTKGILWAPSICGRAIDLFTDTAAIFIY